MIRAFALAAALTASAVTAIAATPNGDRPAPQMRQLAVAEHDLRRARLYADRLERIVKRQVNRAERNERHLKKARRVFRASLNESPTGLHPFETAFHCIHRYEGSWTDPNPPYWGGLQMDRSFQAIYGGWAVQAFGTADRWPISVQMATAIRALVSGRGFYPWPATARKCGLL